VKFIYLIKFLITFLITFTYVFCQSPENEIILNNNIYFTKSDYILIGYGLSKNKKLNLNEHFAIFNYSFNLKKIKMSNKKSYLFYEDVDSPNEKGFLKLLNYFNTYFSLSYLISKPALIIYKTMQKTNSFSFSITNNLEYKKTIISLSLGYSYNFGFNYIGKNPNGINEYKSFSESGFSLCTAIMYRFIYDFAIGPSFCITKSKNSFVYSYNLTFYFSGAYRGKV